MERRSRARRTGDLAALTVVGVAVLAAPAHATYPPEKANGVMRVSKAGYAGVQFVELLDRGGSEEAFTPVFAPYKLAVYDGAANKLGEHTLNPDGPRAAT